MGRFKGTANTRFGFLEQNVKMIVSRTTRRDSLHRKEDQTLQSFMKDCRRVCIDHFKRNPFDKPTAYETLQNLKKLEALALFPGFYVFKKFMRFVNKERQTQQLEDQQRRR